jgi:hypothetical protein
MHCEFALNARFAANLAVQPMIAAFSRADVGSTGRLGCCGREAFIRHPTVAPLVAAARN